MTSYYQSGDIHVVVFLTKSIGILTDNNTDNIKGASVKLYENDVLLGEFAGQVSRYLLELSAPLEVGKTHKLTAEVEGFESVSATQRLPSPPDVSGLVFKPESRVNFEGFLLDAFNFDIHDTPDEDNYYGINVHECSNTINCYGRWAESFTPGVERGSRGTILLKDDLFDGKSYGVELLARPINFSADLNLKVYVSTISRDRYLFSKSAEAYENAQYNPFTEPVIVHTNVENGQGIFSMENVIELIVE